MQNAVIQNMITYDNNLCLSLLLHAHRNIGGQTNRAAITPFERDSQLLVSQSLCIAMVITVLIEMSIMPQIRLTIFLLFIDFQITNQYASRLFQFSEQVP